MLEVELIDRDRFHLYEADWDSLRTGHQCLPILDWTFFCLLVQHFGTGHERLLVARDEGDCMAMGIVDSSSRIMWQTFQPSQAPLGPWLVRRGAEDHTYPHLLKCLPSSCLGFGITQQDPLASAFETNAPNLRLLPYIEVARLLIPEQFDEYWSSRGKNIRQNIRRQLNRMARESIQPEVEIVCEPRGVEDSVREYSQIESRGWKARTGTALQPGNAQEEFYIELMRHHANLDEARVYKMKFNGKTTAIDLCLYRNGTLIILKTTHDEEIDKLSPSMLLKHEMIRGACDVADFRTIEFYGKVMDWHRRLTDDTRGLFHVNLYRSRHLARLDDCRRTVAGWGTRMRGSAQ